MILQNRQSLSLIMLLNAGCPSVPMLLRNRDNPPHFAGVWRQMNRPNARASSDNATGPAVDARRILLPSTHASAPALVKDSISASLMPPSGPTTTYTVRWRPSCKHLSESTAIASSSWLQVLVASWCSTITMSPCTQARLQMAINCLAGHALPQFRRPGASGLFSGGIKHLPPLLIGAPRLPFGDGTISLPWNHLIHTDLRCGVDGLLIVSCFSPALGSKRVWW
mgnify:CR=1 FL=1